VTGTAGAQQITNFDGTLTVSVPYNGPLPATVWYLNNTGELEVIESSYNPATKTVTFTTDHLSRYIIGLDTAIRIMLAIGETDYTVGGVSRTMDTAPEIVNGRTMVPLRFVAEALGAKVDWNNNSRTAIVALNGKTLRVTIGELAPGMDIPAMLINSRTMVPLRYVSETLGCDVDWNEDARTVGITSKRLPDVPENTIAHNQVDILAETPLRKLMVKLAKEEKDVS
jgi:hypothetical protein